MAEPYYRTGQAAKQLGVSSYHIRRLCESGEIEAEISAGQQWKIPVAEIARLKRDGVPPVPVTVEQGHATAESDSEPTPQEGLYADPSDRLIEAAEEVKVAESRLQKRRLERESEEVEDWFRDRQQRQTEQVAAAQRQLEAAQAEQRHQTWMNQWVQYALDTLPLDAPREVELDVHATVQKALAGISPNQPGTITTRLVIAAVEKALRPWRRTQEVDTAIQAAMAKLDWDVRNGSSFAGLKQRAWDAAVAAIRNVREEASYSEMATATIAAVQPIIREYEHVQLCRRVTSCLYVNGATSDEQEAAKEAVRKALAAMPIGATQKQLEQAKETALAPFAAAVAKRAKAERLEAEQQARRRSVERKAEWELDHIARYMKQEFEFEGGAWDMWREVDRLRPVIREALIEELMDRPDMSGEEIRDVIEDLVEDDFSERLQ